MRSLSAISNRSLRLVISNHKTAANSHRWPIRRQSYIYCLVVVPFQLAHPFQLLRTRNYAFEIGASQRGEHFLRFLHFDVHPNGEFRGLYSDNRFFFLICIRGEHSTEYREKRILFTRPESQAIDRLVVSLGTRLNAQVKVSHVVRALVGLMLPAESEIDR